MTFTYDTSDLTSMLAQVRFEVGDTDEATKLFEDEEIDLKIGELGTNVYVVAAALCDILAARFSRLVSTSMGGQSLALSDLASHYRDTAKQLRVRARGGITTVATVKVDPYNARRQFTDRDNSRGLGANRDFDTAGFELP